MKYDFSGWATRNDLRCSDGRTIRKDAFKHCDGKTVPLVWNHQHDGAVNVLGHALLENREDGVYAYGSFNDTQSGREAKQLVKHGDITALSIYANGLKQQGADVIHGAIREVSLVLAGANPGAFIDSVLIHGDYSDEEAIIYTGEELEFFHSDEKKEEEEPKPKKKADEEEEKEPEKDKESKETEEKTPEDSKKEEDEEMEDDKKVLEHKDAEKSEDDETVEDVFNTLSEKQKTVVYALIGQALEQQNGGESEDDEDDSDEGGKKEMKHNVFENDTQETALMHAEFTANVMADAKKYGSLRDSFLAHAEQEYGVENIDFLFPDAKTLTNTPAFIKRPDEWVNKVISGTHHSPFARVKSIFADITEEDARAKGYIKGKKKTEEVFTLLKRITNPTTIYKKQKLDRDDMLDITTFDFVVWLKQEMRGMLDEEIARAILVGDGRPSSSNDKINELSIRPIWTDDDLFTIKQVVNVASNATEDDKAKAAIRAIIKARKNYRGSGSPKMFASEDLIIDMLLLEDTTGRKLYTNMNELAATLRVSEIIPVPVMEGLSREVEGKTHELAAIIVNLADYNVGADKGGEVNMFDDFDIDYNQQKYLMETRCSGALTIPYSAIAVEYVEA